MADWVHREAVLVGVEEGLPDKRGGGRSASCCGRVVVVVVDDVGGRRCQGRLRDIVAAVFDFNERVSCLFIPSRGLIIASRRPRSGSVSP